MPASNAAAATRLSGVAVPALSCVSANAFNLTEALGRKAHDKTAYAAIAHEEIGPDADCQDRIFFGNGLEECRQIFLIGRLEHDLGRAACTEPRDFFHAHIGRQTPAQTRKSIAQLFQQGFAINQ